MARRVFRMLVLALATLLLPGTGSAQGSRAWVGVVMAKGPAGGVVVRAVIDGSPAAKALQRDDMLLSADGVTLDQPGRLGALVRTRSPGDKLTIRLRRGGREHDVTLTLVAHPGQDEIVRRMWVGKTAPDLGKLAPVSGAVPDTMKPLAGKVVLLDFFAGWCVGCRAFAPQLGAWHGKYAAKGVTLVGVTSDDVPTAKAVTRAWKLPYPVGSDGAGAAAKAYRVMALPALFIIDKKGVIRDALIGYDPSRRASTEKLIEKLLKEK